MLEGNYTFFNQTICPTILNAYEGLINETSSALEPIRSLANQAIGTYLYSSCRTNPSLAGCTPFMLGKIFIQLGSIDQSIKSLLRQGNNIIGDISLNYSIHYCWNMQWIQCAKGVSTYAMTWIFDSLIPS